MTPEQLQQEVGKMDFRFTNDISRIDRSLIAIQQEIDLKIKNLVSVIEGQKKQILNTDHNVEVIKTKFLQDLNKILNEVEVTNKKCWVEKLKDLFK